MHLDREQAPELEGFEENELAAISDSEESDSDDIDLHSIKNSSLGHQSMKGHSSTLVTTDQSKQMLPKILRSRN